MLSYEPRIAHEATPSRLVGQAAEVMGRHRQRPHPEGAQPRAGFSETVVFLTPKGATTLPRRPEAVMRSECAPKALWMRRRVR